MDKTILDAIGLNKDELKEMVISRIIQDISYDNGDFNVRLNSEIKAKIEDSVRVIAEREVLPDVEKYIHELTIQKTNAYGEPKGDPQTIVEYIGEYAKKYMTEEVNYEGRGRKEAWGSFTASSTRLAYMIDKYLHYHIEKSMKDILKKANDVLVDGIKKTVETKLRSIQKDLKVTIK